MISIRCSELDRTLECSGSLVAPRYPVNYPNPAANTGTAGHGVLARVIGDGIDPDDAIDEALAGDSALDRSDLDFCVSEAMRAWRELAPGIAEPRVETAVRSRYCHGTADVVSVTDRACVVVDWKMGYASDLHDAQLTGYAAGAVELLGRWPDSGYVRTIEVHVRQGTWRERHITPTHIADFERELERRLTNPERQWAPGRACTYCPSRHECGARADFLRGSAAMLSAELAKVPSRAALAALYDRAEVLRLALGQYWAAINTSLDDGPLDLNDGRTIRWKEYRIEKIKVGAAWSVLQEAGLQSTDLLESLKLTKKALKKTIEKDVPRGQKQKRSDAVLSALRSAGAIETEIQTRRSVQAPKGDA